MNSRAKQQKTIISCLKMAFFESSCLHLAADCTPNLNMCNVSCLKMVWTLQPFRLALRPLMMGWRFPTKEIGPQTPQTLVIFPNALVYFERNRAKYPPGLTWDRHNRKEEEKIKKPKMHPHHHHSDRQSLPQY